MRPLSNDLRERVVAAVGAGDSCRSVAARFDVAASTVVKWSQRYRATGSVAPGKVGGHRKPVLDAHRAFIRKRIDQTPHLTLHKLKDELAGQGVVVSHNAVWTFLHREGLSFKKIKKSAEEKRERFLSPAELKRVGEVLREMESEGIELPSAIAATRLLILTGCRLNEIMTLQWEHVDLPGKALRLPDSKTGAKVVHLGQPAIDVLEKIARVETNPWVIVGTLPGARLTDLQPFWQPVRTRAGLNDVRIHDLRHTFASTAVASGQGLPMIGKLLGHTQVQTTARYAHLASATVKTAASDVSAEIAASLNGQAA